MKIRWLGILKITGIAISGLVALAVAALVWLVVNPWPQTSGNLAVAGLKDKVTVTRDTYGIPNIYAQNDHDLFFSQGYVHAQDRLFQMEINRRVGNGTLSELVGAQGVSTDKISRTYGLRRTAEKSYPLLDDDIKAQLQAYCDGINAYIATHLDKLPVEFTLLGAKPAAWTPLDSLAWANMMALLNALNSGYELFRAQIDAKLGAQMANDAVPAWDPENPEIITKDLEKYSWGAYVKAALTPTARPADGKAADAKPAKPVGLLDNPAGLDSSRVTGVLNLEDYIPGASQFGWASGTWAVSGKYTESGKPLLACDVHMGLNIPSVWYEVGMHNARFDVSGFSLPGVPLILLGHNHDIAWGFVNLNSDVTDLYREKLDSTTAPAKYQYMGQWYDLEKKREVINVKGKDPVFLDLLFTRHGPLINDLINVKDSDVQDEKDFHKFDGQWPPITRERWEGVEPISLRWAVNDGCLVLKSVFLLNQAKNWEDFHHALSFWDSLGESFVYADNQGNIGYQAAAKIPLRGPKAVGVKPVPGWDADYDWKGYIPYEDLPRLYNPPTGYVATANNKTTTDDYPYLITYDWFHPGYRARSLNTQLQALIQSGKKLTMDDMRDIQADTFSYSAVQIQSYLKAVVPEGKTETIALDLAQKWNGRFDTQSVGASIYQAWYTYLDNNTYGDNLREKSVWGYGLPLKHIESMVKILKEPENPWFDDVTTTDKKETRDDIIRVSFHQAIAFLTKTYGDDPEQWQLGKFQTVTLQHQILGNIPVLGGFFNSQQTLPFAGSPTSVAFAYSLNSAPLKENITFAANQRHIVSLDDLDKTLSVVSAGASGQIFHPHREDQMKLWAAVRYHPMPFTRDQVTKLSTEQLFLSPKE